MWSFGRPRPGVEVCQVLRLGRLDYLDARELQRELVAARGAGRIPDTLVLLEHPHTYTNGRAGRDANLLIDDKQLAAIGASYVRADRGGDITYHGPGQIVGYPILDLRRWRQDLHLYLRALEEVLIVTLADFGIAAGRLAGCTGVWVGEKKIAAIGVRVNSWITSHGFALNVDTDLSYFRHIVPCGLIGKEATSMARILGHQVGNEAVESRLLHFFGQAFCLEMGPRSIAGSTTTLDRELCSAPPP
ncbi:MAG: lipoyl(octanoyl) transferase LipB [Chloroflexi bacterium]|nr:lipoyl(octanoyl) transferase LipB [Chloroflexota bacterium]